VQDATSYVQGGNDSAALAKCTAIISTGPFTWKHAAGISYGQAMDLNAAMGNQESKTEQLAKYDPNVTTTMCALVNPNLVPANQLDVFVVSSDDKLIELGLLQQ
jgi:anti-sigma-K factor RskA